MTRKQILRAIEDTSINYDLFYHNYEGEQLSSAQIEHEIEIDNCLIRLNLEQTVIWEKESDEENYSLYGFKPFSLEALSFQYFNEIGEKELINIKLKEINKILKNFI